MNLLDILFPKINGQITPVATYLPSPYITTVTAQSKQLTVSKYIDKVWYVFDYKDPVIKDSIEKIKLGLEHSRIEEYQTIVQQVYRHLNKIGQLTDIDCITSVSNHQKRLSLRGFSIADSIAQSIDKTIYKPLFVITNTHTEMAKLNKKSRLTTLISAKLIKNPPNTIKKVLLIDDIATTGRTLSEHSKVIKARWKGCKVFCLVIACS